MIDARANVLIKPKITQLSKLVNRIVSRIMNAHKHKENNQSGNSAKIDMLSYAHKIFFISYSLTIIIYAV